MLAEREENKMVIKMEQSDNERQRGREMQSLEVSILKEYTDEWEQQTKTPSQAERPP